MEFNLINLKLCIRTTNRNMLCKRLMFAAEEFSEACKQAVCRSSSRDCSRCSANGTCDWLLVFGQQLSVDPEALRRHQKPPLPFIFSFPPTLNESHDEHALLECGMVVVGRAITGLEMLLRGFRRLLSDNDGILNSELIRLSSCDCQGNSYRLDNGENLSNLENLVVMSAEDILSKCPWECENVTVRLLSPLRLFSRGRQLGHFDFTLFARSLMRRVSSLAYYYCGYEFNCDFKLISDSVSRVVCVEDHFEAGGSGTWKASGMSGYGCFAGSYSGLLPILMLGMYVHAGKNASFGMGAYQLECS